jgi:hypothetical protein
MAPADSGARVEEARREGEGFQLDGANSDPEFILSISAWWSGKELGAALGLVVRYINAAELAASSPRAETTARKLPTVLPEPRRIISSPSRLTFSEIPRCFLQRRAAEWRRSTPVKRMNIIDCNLQRKQRH